MKKYAILPSIFLTCVAVLAFFLGFIHAGFGQNISLWSLLSPRGVWLSGPSSAHGRLSEERIEMIFSDHLPLAFQKESRSLARHMIRLCDRYQFDPAFVLALIQRESRFDPKAVSSAGAVGLMQLMPRTARGLVRQLGFGERGEHLSKRLPTAWVSALKDPYFSLSLGVAYLYELKQRYPEVSPYYMLAAYNLGPGRLRILLTDRNYRPSAQIERYIQGIRDGVDSFRRYRSKETRA